MAHASHHAPERRGSALGRQDVSDAQSPEQRIITLDARLGEGVGATKERKRLAVKITARQASEQPKPKKNKGNPKGKKGKQRGADTTKKG